ncbi:MAG: transglutaminase domain-containing protein, partial [Sedimentisphaerales bacterium]|nr:transglutaminase domain-containing protein [Sedimentisphaerales bacterium]
MANILKVTLVLLLIVFVSPFVWAEAAPDSTEYFAIFMNGQKVGHGLHQRMVEAGRVRTTEEMTLSFQRGQDGLVATMSETSIETVKGRPAGFESVIKMGAIAIESKGSLNAEGQMEVGISGVEQKRIIDLPPEALMSEGLRLLLQSKKLENGLKFDVKMFSPSMLKVIEAQIQVGETQPVDLLGRVVPLTEVATALKMKTGSLNSVSYVDKDFNPQKMISTVMGMNIELIACSREFALSANDVPDFVEHMVMASPAPIPNFSTAKSISYHLQPKGEEKLMIPSTDNQTVTSDGQGGLWLTVKPVRPSGKETFPYKGKDKAALEALKPTRFLQSDDDKIKELARQAIGEAKDASEAIKKIELFVHNYVDEKNLSVGYASAAEVAQSRQGDCTEHAVLCAALCRAVGIPA